MAASLGEDAKLLVEAVRAGGEVALARFRAGDWKRWTKKDGTPVTDADMAVDERLSETLCGARPDYGWLSEETGRRGETAQRSFVVDPIDGTSAFVGAQNDWTVVAALIEDGRPVAGAIHRPVTGTTYHAAKGEGAWCDGTRLAVSERATLEGALVASPGTLFRDAGFVRLGATRPRTVGSLALRLAKVASGEFDAVLTKAGPHHWDLAAADIIVQEAGGTLIALEGHEVRYDRPSTRHGSVVAGSEALVAEVRRIASSERNTV